MPFPIPGLNTALFALLLRPNRTQQFQKNAYHNDKCVISEPPQKACTSTRKAPSPLTLSPNMIQYSPTSTFPRHTSTNLHQTWTQDPYMHKKQPQYSKVDSKSSHLFKTKHPGLMLNNEQTS